MPKLMRSRFASLRARSLVSSLLSRVKDLSHHSPGGFHPFASLGPARHRMAGAHAWRQAYAGADGSLYDAEPRTASV
eukprot:3600540-Pleurochrysis_carterae.AAC.1